MKKILAGLVLIGVLALSSCGTGYSAGERPLPEHDTIASSILESIGTTTEESTTTVEESTTKEKVKVEYCSWWKFKADQAEDDPNNYMNVGIDAIYINPCEGCESLYVVNEDYLNNEVLPNLEDEHLKIYTFTEGTDKLVLAKVDVSTYKEVEHNGHYHYITYIEK